jgi:putative membrane protein
MKGIKRDHLIGLARTLIIWFSSALGLVLLGRIIPNVTVENLYAALSVVIVISLINAVLWPILSYYALPFLVFSLGLGTLLLNALMIWLALNFVPGISIPGFWPKILTLIGVTAINMIVSSILTIDDDASYFRSVVHKRAGKSAKKPDSKPGFVFLEIDGLSEKVLRKAISEGHMPTLSRWLNEGSHKICGWETDLSCQTGACQAGILHGKNQDMPAFRWLEKGSGNRIMVSTGLSDAPVLEKRISNGHGLLAANGASCSNLFSGDAANVMFTYSQLTDMGRFYNSAWYFFYAEPYNLIRTMVLTVWDVLLELHARWRQWRDDVRPRLTHIGFYPITRAFINVFLREMTTFTLIGNIATGKVDTIYATYVGYDEIAHHLGVEDDDALFALRKLDKQFSWMEKTAIESARPYHLIVLSDHGQSNGATFKQRYGITLEELVKSLLPEDLPLYSQLDTNQDHFGQALSYPVEKGKALTRTAVRHATRERYGRENVGISEKDARVVVLASGNLGLIYLTDWKGTASYEQIMMAFPSLIPELRKHEGIGFLMVRSVEHGPLVIGAGGIYYLAEDRVDGLNPLSNFGPRAADHLRRTAGFRHVPDILINSFYDSEKDEVAAFEELIGSHGGLGGNQSRPFLMYPSKWDLEKEEIVGAEQVYGILKSELEHALSREEKAPDSSDIEKEIQPDGLH